jgi:hypothetical protein
MNFKQLTPVAVMFAAMNWIAPAQLSASDKDEVTFDLVANPKFAACLAQPGRTPSAKVSVDHGELNDRLILKLKNIKPGLAFDLFMVQRSSLKADGTPDTAFSNFGLAWYQSDVKADEGGESVVQIKTILLDQIFGFDPDAGLQPLNTFHVGFWFNDPKDAAACGFDVNKPTPFNGEHKAGPLAMISLPNASSGLGPLCTNPDPSHPGTCHP